MQQQPPQKNSKKSANDFFKAYARYSSIGFQMLFVILAGFFAGNYLDKRFENTNTLFTVVGISAAVIVSTIWIIWKLVNDK